MTEERTQQRGSEQLGTVTTKVPARLDRLPWSRWHWMIVIGRRQCCIPDRERGLPDGNQGAGDLVLLRDRHRGGRHQRTVLFSSLVSTGKVSDTVIAFSIGAVLMILAGFVEIFLGVKAERRSLEDIATPLTAQQAQPTGASG